MLQICARCRQARTYFVQFSAKERELAPPFPLDYKIIIKILMINFINKIIILTPFIMRKELTCLF